MSMTISASDSKVGSVVALFRDDDCEQPQNRPRPQFKHVTARLPT